MPKAVRTPRGKHKSSVKLPYPPAIIVDDARSLKSSVAPEENTGLQSELDISELRTQQSKKAKQIGKREAFLSRLSLSSIQGSKSHRRRLKRKAKEQLSGGFGDLQSALTTLKEDVAEQEFLSTIGTLQDETIAEVTARPGTIGKGGASTLSKAQRKRVFELERFRHPLILTNSEFSTNPFQTIRTHAQNTLLTKP